MNWTFEKVSAGIEKQGIRDNDIQVFDKYRIPSVVREAIQNSLDAVMDENKPVLIEFSFGKLNKSEVPSLFSIEKHIEACFKETKKGTEDYEVLAEMVEQIRLNHFSVPYLQISDFNTFGMDEENAYDAFAFSRNINWKQDDSSGGSKGMGKSAFFSNSYLRTVLVSSKYYEDNRTLFQGISRLASHQLDGQDYYFKGFFGEEEFKPSLYPPFGILRNLFSRTTAGTSIGIIGLWKAFDGDIQNQIIKAVILNFWLAILRNKLVVKINQNYIDADNVYDLCGEHWPTYKGTKTGESINPRQFIECYLEKVESQKFVETIDKLGEVELILGKHSEFNGRISFFRKSNMLIDTKLRGNPNHNGYAGVFICENKEGNGILKRLENPRHDEWSSKNYKHPEGRAALRVLEDFISKSYKDFYSIENESEITIAKLGEFIQIDHRKKSDIKPRRFNTKKKEIKVGPKRESVGGGGDKKIFGLLCHANKNQKGQWVYHVDFRAAEDISEAVFQVLVSGDNDKAGLDNVLPIIQVNDELITNGSHRIKMNIQKGENRFSFILQDEDKHALNLKLI